MEDKFDEIIKILEFIEESEYQFMDLDTADIKLVVNKKGKDISIEDRKFTNQAEKTLTHNSSDEENKSLPPKKSDKKEEKNNGETSYINDDNYYIVRAPMLGTFYRSSSPEESPYVNINDEVKSEDTICLIEVMKLFNSISAGTNGEIVEFFVEDGAMVEYEQPIAAIRIS